MGAINSALRAHLAGCAALLAVVTPRAHAQKIVPPAITWCDAPAKKPEWANQSVYLNLIEAPSRTPFSRDALDNVVIAVATQIRALPGLIAADKPDDKGSMLPSSGSRYSPVALLGDVQFQMTPDGKVGRIAFHDVRDTSLAHDIKVALRNVSAAAPKEDPDSTVHFHDFLLAPNFESDKSIASFPLFRILAPRSRNAEMVKRSRKELPFEFREWEVSLNLTFIVDTAGKVEHESIQPSPDVASLSFKTPQEREMYLRYVETTKALVEDSKFTPAEFLGCRLRQNITFSADFRVR